MRICNLTLAIALLGFLGLPRLAAGASTVRFSSATFEINELDGRPMLKLECTPAVASQTRVIIKATGGTAEWPADYLPNEIELQIPAGSSTWESDVLTVVDDGLPETDETVELTIISVEGGAIAGSLTNATLIIHNGQPRVTFETEWPYHSSYALENEPFAFTAVRSGDTNVAVAFDVTTTTNGTALPGVDFVPVNERFVFQPGETRKGIVPLLDDGKVEPAESIELMVSNPSEGATLVGTNVTAVIFDDEVPANLDLNFAPEFSRWPWHALHATATTEDGVVAVQADGKILVAGPSLFQQGSHVAMVRYHRDGRLDTSFRFDLRCDITAISPAHDGKTIIAGRRYDTGDPMWGRPFVARLLPTGTVDSTFAVSTDGWNGSTPQMLVQANGQVVLWGGAIGGMQRLNLNGSVDASFAGHLPSLGFVEQAALHLDDKLLLRVQDWQQGVLSYRLIRLNPNGSQDTSFTGPSSPGRFLVLTDGGIMIQTERFVRLLRNGEIDASFSDGRLIPGSAAREFHPYWAETMLAELDGYLYFVPGEAGPNGPGLARLRPDGSLDTWFAGLWGGNRACGWLTYGGARWVHAKAVVHDGALLCWNHPYTMVNGVTRPLARILHDAPPQAFVVQGESVSAQQRGLAAYESVGQVQLRIQRLGDASSPCSVRFSTQDGTARATEHYVHTSGTLTFAPLEKEKTITVPLIQDSVFRGKPNFLITLSDPSIAAALDPPVCVYIYDREPGLVSTELLRYADMSHLRFELTGPAPQRQDQTGFLLEGSDDLKAWSGIYGFGVEEGCRGVDLPRNARRYIFLPPDKPALFLRLRAVGTPSPAGSSE